MTYPDVLTAEEIKTVAQSIRQRSSVKPRVGMILGSGLGPLADAIDSADRIPTTEVEGWPRSTVEGHQGRLLLGQLEGHSVFAMEGRVHFYEGYPMTRIGLSVRVMRKLGVEILLITNAAGAVNPDYEPGDLMMLNDHINLIGMTGQSPLRGPNLDDYGPRFPDMSRPYDIELRNLANQTAADNEITLHEGVYICLAGPSFETPADLRFLRGIGVDAVGMSTVPETTVARHSGMKVLAISGISNKANLDGNTTTTHEEVLQAGEIIVPKLTTVLRGVLKRL